MAYLKVRVTPAARQDTLMGWQGDVLRLTVRAAPQRGKANDAICRFLAQSLGLSPSQVTIVRGTSSREKLLRIEGLDEGAVRRLLGR